MLKSLITAAVLAATTLVVAPQAEAAECTRGRGYTICYKLIGKNGSYNRWRVTLQNAQTTEYMDVTCYGKSVDTWNSNGGFSQAEAEYLATEFCKV